MEINIEDVKSLKKILDEIISETRQVERAHERGGRFDSPAFTAKLHAHRGRLCFRAQELMEESGINRFAYSGDTYHDGWAERKL